MPYIFIIFITIFLISCKKPITQDYLLEHPVELRKEFTKCQQNAEDTSYCDAVIQSAQEFAKLSNQQQSNPEDFGQQVLLAQEQLVVLQGRLGIAQNNYQTLQSNQNSNPELKLAEDKLLIAKNAYQVQEQHIKVMLAVISDTSTPGL